MNDQPACEDYEFEFSARWHLKKVGEREAERLLRAVKFEFPAPGFSSYAKYDGWDLVYATVRRRGDMNVSRISCGFRVGSIDAMTDAVLAEHMTKMRYARRSCLGRF